MVHDGAKFPVDDGFLVGGGLVGPVVFLQDREHRVDGLFEVEASTAGGACGKSVEADDGYGVQADGDHPAR